MNSRKQLFSFISHIVLILVSGCLSVFLYLRFKNLPPDSVAADTNCCFQFGLSISAFIICYNLGRTACKLFKSYSAKRAVPLIIGVVFVSFVLQGLFPMLPSMGTATLVFSRPWTNAGTAERICALLFWLSYLLISFHILEFTDKYKKFREAKY